MIPRWLLWTLLAVFCWGIWAVLGKLIGDALSPAHTQALSTIGLIPVMLGLGICARPVNPGNRLRGILFALGAGVLSSLGNIAYYDALNRGPKAATVVPLTALYPLVTVLLAMVVLRERLNRVQTAGIILSLVAIYLFNVQQEQGFLSTWLVVALIPIVLWGITGLLQKLSTNHISGELSTLWFLAAFVPVGALLLLGPKLPPSISLKMWLLAGALGFTLALGNYALLAAFAAGGKASILAPLGGLYPLVSIPIAIVALRERVGWRESLGILLALLSVVALSCESRPAAPGTPKLKPEIAP